MHNKHGVLREKKFEIWEKSIENVNTRTIRYIQHEISEILKWLIYNALGFSAQNTFKNDLDFNRLNSIVCSQFEATFPEFEPTFPESRWNCCRPDVCHSRLTANRKWHHYSASKTEIEIMKNYKNHRLKIKIINNKGTLNFEMSVWHS